MKKYVDFPLEENERIRVEVADAEERVTRGDTKAVIETASVAFDKALSKLKPMCAAIVRQVRNAVEQPEEIEVEFGVKMSAEAGIILTSTSGEANLKISVKWKRQAERMTNPSDPRASSMITPITA
jgi:molybdenum cofactor biosynthesis enzyme